MLWLLFGYNTYMAYIMHDQGGLVDRKVVWGNAMRKAWNAKKIQKLQILGTWYMFKFIISLVFVVNEDSRWCLWCCLSISL